MQRMERWAKIITVDETDREIFEEKLTKGSHKWMTVLSANTVVVDGKVHWTAVIGGRKNKIFLDKY